MPKKNPDRKDDGELAHRELGSRLETIFDRSRDVIGAGNLDGYFTSVNASVERILGYTVAEFLSVPFLHFVHPDDFEKTKMELEAAARGKNEISIENRYRCADGSFKWLDWRVFADVGEGSFIAVGRDISARKKNEEQLLLQREILNNMAEGVSLTRSEDLTIISVNRKFERMFGYAPGEIIGRHISIIFPEADKNTQEHIARIEAVLKQRGEWHGEVANARKDGSIFWCSTNVSTFDHPTIGKVFISIRTDITEKKQTKEVLAKREELFRDFVEGTDNLVAQVDAAGRLTYVNDAAMKVFGLPKEKCIGLSAFDFIHPEDREKTKRAFQGWIRDRMPSVTFENRQVSRSGIIRHMLWTINLYFDDKGEVTRINNIARDITDRRKMEDALRRSESQKDLLLNSAGEGIYGLDKEGRTTFVNRAAQRMLGYSAEEMIGKSNHALIHHSCKDGHPYEEGECRMMEAIRQDRQISVTDEVLWRKDGSRFPVEYSSTPIRHDNLATGAVVIFSDITEKEKQQEQKRQLEEHYQQMQKHLSLNSMAAGIAHNFNNILMAVMGNLELALLSTSAEAKQYELLQAALQASQRAAKLSSMMLQFVGQAPVEMRLFPLSDLVREMVDVLVPQTQCRIDLSPECEGDIYVNGDMAMVRQVIANLVTNAAEAIGEKKNGRITLQCGKRSYSKKELGRPYVQDVLPAGDYAYLKVMDNGPGMAKEVLARAFDPFFSTKFHGRGLGLATVLGIMRTHKGTVFLESTPRKGTVATILFPGVALHSNPQEKEGKSSASSGIMTGTVLLVDDDPMLRDLGKNLLLEIGFEVLLASDGVEALELFTEQKEAIDLVLLDVAMPRLDGFGTLRKMRRQSKVPVIMITGYAIEDVAEQLAGLSWVTWLQKPFSREELQAKMRGMLHPDK